MRGGTVILLCTVRTGRQAREENVFYSVWSWYGAVLISVTVIQVRPPGYFIVENLILFYNHAHRLRLEKPSCLEGVFRIETAVA
jgi:hypothetical protein